MNYFSATILYIKRNNVIFGAMQRGFIYILCYAQSSPLREYSPSLLVLSSQIVLLSFSSHSVALKCAYTFASSSLFSHSGRSILRFFSVQDVEIHQVIDLNAFKRLPIFDKLFLLSIAFLFTYCFFLHFVHTKIQHQLN